MTVSKIRRKEDIENFKNTVLDTAIRLMHEENDWGMVSVNKIATIMRYTPPNIYHYFENKDDILFQLGCRGSRILNAKFEAVYSNMSYSPREKLRQIGVAYLEFSEEHGELYDLMFHVKQKKLDKRLISKNIIIIQDIVKSVNPSIKTDDEAYKIYQGLHCLLHGYISIKRNNRIPMGDDAYFNNLINEALRKFVEDV
jgi:AcrR family transcriptional regulator